MEQEKVQARDQDGKYKLWGNWDRVCVCGHRLGDHFAESPRNCCVDDSEEHCIKFRETKDKEKIQNAKKHYF